MMMMMIAESQRSTALDYIYKMPWSFVLVMFEIKNSWSPRGLTHAGSHFVHCAWRNS
jgi:hypothetical protein